MHIKMCLNGVRGVRGAGIEGEGIEGEGKREGGGRAKRSHTHLYGTS